MERRCSSCGAPIEKGQFVCPKCGQQNKQFVAVSSNEGDSISLESNRKFVSCEGCGVGMKATALYCPKCGKSQSEIGTARLPELPVAEGEGANWILVQVGEEEGTAVSIADGLIIGRNKHDIFGIENQFVSERHLQVYKDEEGIWIQDMGSTNGTFLDGSAVSWERIPFVDGIRLRLGTELIVRLSLIKN